MTVRGVWFLKELHEYYIAELSDGALVKFRILPVRDVTNDVMMKYEGLHPKDCKGEPINDHLYKLYGLTKEESETASEFIRARVTPTEKAKFEQYVASLRPKKTVSEFIREYVQSCIGE